jgi:uncharacterized protein
LSPSLSGTEGEASPVSHGSRDMPHFRTHMTAAAFLFCLVCLFPLRAEGLLDKSPQGAVSDFASLMSEQARASLETVCRSLLDKTGVSCVFATVADLEGNDINDLATKLFQKWGVGKKGVDEGVLVLVSVNDRRIRIETGYGSEGYLTDAQAARIIRDIMQPAFAHQQWDEGFLGAMAAIVSLAATAHNASPSEIMGNVIDVAPAQPVRPMKMNIFGILFFSVLLLFLVSTRFGRSLLFFMLLSSLSSSGRSSGRGFGGGFGGGGFSGFGGGMSGGGGATGRF